MFINSLYISLAISMPFNYPVHLGGYLKDVRLQRSPFHVFDISIFLKSTGQYAKNSYLVFFSHMSLLVYDSTYL